MSGTTSFRRKESVSGASVNLTSDVRPGLITVYSFRPCWSSFLSTAAPTNLEFPVIIPDVVFPARIDTSYPRLQEALKYHPAYVFSCGASHPAYIDIPILVIEYKKRYSENNDSRGNEDHRKHLTAAMTAALPLYSGLGIETPLCGLFLKHYGVDTLMGTVGDSPAEGRTVRVVSSFEPFS